MDLNELFQREGEERRRADLAACTSSRQAHLGLARGYRDRIAQLGSQAPEARPAGPTPH